MRQSVTPEAKVVPLITEELFREAYEFHEVGKPKLKTVLRKSLKCSRQTFLNLFPFAKWITTYRIKKDALNDLIAGITVAIMHIPHGLAYAPLGHVNVVVGFYMAVFPVLVYMLLGTSHHISIGTFAVVCAMTGQTVVQHPDYEIIADLVVNYTQHSPAHGNATVMAKQEKNLSIAITICFLVGVFQTVLGLLKLGSFTVIMSESMVGGYTCGAAVHVLSYQLKNLFGVHVGDFSGSFKLFRLYIDFFKKINTVNLVTMGMSLVSMTILVIFNDILKPLMQKRFPKNKIPVPIELFVIMLGILASYFLDLSKKYNVHIVQHLPTGFPEPMLPSLGRAPWLLFDSFLIAVVAIAINLSLAKIFAKKAEYEVSDNQEILAYGVANIFASFFQCLPSAASLSRSTIQYNVGGRTQLASLVSVCIITFILLFAGEIFEPVPFCVLSSIVVVTLKGLLMQITSVPKIWRQSYWDGIVWVTTFLAVVILNLDLGLGLGLLMCLITITFRFYILPIRVLGRVRDTNVYLDVKYFRSATQLDKILILQPVGELNYTNCGKFEYTVLKQFKAFARNLSTDDKSYVVLDMRVVPEIDPTAVNVLKHLSIYLKKSNCLLYVADCNVIVYRTFEVCNLFKELPKEQILASVADAVDYLTSLK